MRVPQSLLAGAALALAACAQETQLQYDESIVPMGDHPVLVFGIDGATWDVIDPLIEAGELPNLAALKARSLRGVLESELPANSPVVWSTIFTGKQPPQHGVRDWARSQSVHRRVKALWDVTSECGVVTHVHNVPASWPPVAIHGHMLSGFPLSGSTIGSGTGEVLDFAADRSTWPASATDNLAAIQAAAAPLAVGAWSDWFDGLETAEPTRRGRLRVKRISDTRLYVSPIYRADEGLIYSYPSRYQAEVGQRLGTTYVPEGPGWSKHAEQDTASFLYEHLAQVAELQTRAALFATEEPWQLLVYVSTLVDRTSHPYWPFLRPADYPALDPAAAAPYAETVLDAYRATDEQLGRFLAAIPGDAYVVVASDHGFASDLKGEKEGIEGIHHQDGIYLVSGPGIAAADGPRAEIEDICPTVLHLLGLPVAADMAGSAIPPVAEAELGHPLRTVETFETGRRYVGEEPAASFDPSTGEVDAATWKQLRDLGYVGDDPSEDD
jgi:predicted AlkP superfamily phosphohydrolase/phosphomutase